MTRNVFVSLLLSCTVAALPAAAEQAKPIPPEKFGELHGMFKSQPGESKFWGLPWMIQLDEAIAKGAAEGKPIFVWCGAGGAPVGVC
jgi:hypothetical protein